MIPKSHIGHQWLACAAVLAVLAACTSEEHVGPGASQAKLATQQQAYANEPYQVKIVDRRKFAARYQPAVVAAPAGYSANTIVIDTRAKQLYLTGTDGKARPYGIADGVSGHAWSGSS